MTSRPLTILPLLLAATGCDLIGDRVCTQIGCDSGLIIEVTASPSTTPITVTATAPGTSPKTATCVPSTGTCSVGFEDFTPSSVTVQVTRDSQSGTATFQPAYQTMQPNGPDCPPICRTARLAINLPQPAAAA